MGAGAPPMIEWQWNDDGRRYAEGWCLVQRSTMGAFFFVCRKRARPKAEMVGMIDVLQQSPFECVEGALLPLPVGSCLSRDPSPRRELLNAWCVGESCVFCFHIMLSPSTLRNFAGGSERHTKKRYVSQSELWWGQQQQRQQACALSLSLLCPLLRVNSKYLFNFGLVHGLSCKLPRVFCSLFKDTKPKKAGTTLVPEDRSPG